jgi:hypothetical protein
VTVPLNASTLKLGRKRLLPVDTGGEIEVTMYYTPPPEPDTPEQLVRHLSSLRAGVAAGEGRAEVAPAASSTAVASASAAATSATPLEAPCVDTEAGDPSG